MRFNPQGELISEHEWTQNHTDWLPSQADKDFVKSLMHAVTEPGKIAGWIAPPKKGINSQGFEYEYVRHPGS